MWWRDWHQVPGKRAQAVETFLAFSSPGGNGDKFSDAQHHRAGQRAGAPFTPKGPWAALPLAGVSHGVGVFALIGERTRHLASENE